MGILDAQIPSQRWALPSDSDRDKYDNQYDAWLNEHFDPATNTIFGIPHDEAWDDGDLFEQFMDEKNYERMP